MSIETLRLQQIEIEHGEDRDDVMQQAKEGSSAELEPIFDDFNLVNSTLSGSTGNLADADLPLPFDLTAEDLKEVESLFDSSQLDFDKPAEMMLPPVLEPRATHLFQQQQQQQQLQQQQQQQQQTSLVAALRNRVAPLGTTPWSQHQQYSQPAMGNSLPPNPPTGMYRHRPYQSWPGRPRHPHPVEQQRYAFARDRHLVPHPGQQHRLSHSELLNALQRRYLGNQSQQHQHVRHVTSVAAPAAAAARAPMVRPTDVWHPPTPPSYRFPGERLAGSVMQNAPSFPSLPSVPRPDVLSFQERHRLQSPALPRPPVDAWNSSASVPVPRPLQGSMQASEISHPMSSGDVSMDQSMMYDTSDELERKRLEDKDILDSQYKLEFPPDCVEATEPVFTSRHKVTAQSLGE